MLEPKASNPISSARNLTSGARHSRPVSSTMRMILSAAAWGAQRFQTPSTSSAVTEPASRAVVRLSGVFDDFPARAVGMPPVASAIAAVRPAGPRPTTTTGTLSSCICGIRLLRLPINRTSTCGPGSETLANSCDTLPSPYGLSTRPYDRNRQPRFQIPAAHGRGAWSRFCSAESGRSPVRGCARRPWLVLSWSVGRRRRSSLADALQSDAGRGLECPGDCGYRVNVVCNDACDDAAKRGTDDPDLCGNRRYCRAQGAGYCLSFHPYGRLRGRLDRLFNCVRADAGYFHANGAFRCGNTICQQLVRRRSFYWRRRLSI